MIEIKLTKGYTAIIDDVDADLAKRRWRSFPHGQTVYARGSRRKNDVESVTSLHRTILARKLGRALAHGEVTDHLNGNGLDCRRDNLRVATVRQNSRNKRTVGSKLKGAFLIKGKSKPWQARIRVDGKLINIGTYATERLAHEAYCEAALLYHGAFANDGTRPLRLADAPVAMKQLSLFDMMSAAMRDVAPVAAPETEAA